MRPFYLIFFLLAHVIGYSQTYYLTGRPFPLERNNAIKEVAKQWGLDVKYAGNDVVEAVGLDELNKEVDRVDSIIALTKGKEWLSYFFSEVDKQQAIHELIRHHLYNVNIPAFSITSKYSEGVEIKIIIGHLKRKKYLASIIFIKNNEAIGCDSTYLIKWNRRKKMRIQEECKVFYQFPENGIIIK